MGGGSFHREQHSYTCTHAIALTSCLRTRTNVPTQPQIQQTHTHTHTERQTSIANEWLGGREPLLASRKSPNHPITICQLSCKLSPSPWWQTTPPSLCPPIIVLFRNPDRWPHHLEAARHSRASWAGAGRSASLFPQNISHTPTLTPLTPPTTSNLKNCNIPGFWLHWVSTAISLTCWSGDRHTYVSLEGFTFQSVTCNTWKKKGKKTSSVSCYKGQTGPVYDPSKGKYRLQVVMF